MFKCSYLKNKKVKDYLMVSKDERLPWCEWSGEAEIAVFRIEEPDKIYKIIMSPDTVQKEKIPSFRREG